MVRDYKRPFEIAKPRRLWPASTLTAVKVWLRVTPALWRRCFHFTDSERTRHSPRSSSPYMALASVTSTSQLFCPHKNLALLLGRISTLLLSSLLRGCTYRVVNRLFGGAETRAPWTTTTTLRVNSPGGSWIGLRTTMRALSVLATATIQLKRSRVLLHSHPRTSTMLRTTMFSLSALDTSTVQNLLDPA